MRRKEWLTRVPAADNLHVDRQAPYFYQIAPEPPGKSATFNGTVTLVGCCIGARRATSHQMTAS
jgi:hypothetical protein